MTNFSIDILAKFYTITRHKVFVRSSDFLQQTSRFTNMHQSNQLIMYAHRSSQYIVEPRTPFLMDFCVTVVFSYCCHSQTICCPIFTLFPTAILQPSSQHTQLQKVLYLLEIMVVREDGSQTGWHLDRMVVTLCIDAPGNNNTD